MEQPPDGVPVLQAWPDCDGDGDQLHIRVTEDGTDYGAVDKNIELLTKHQGFVNEFEEPILSLLSLYNRQIREQVEGDEKVIEAAED